MWKHEAETINVVTLAVGMFSKDTHSKAFYLYNVSVKYVCGWLEAVWTIHIYINLSDYWVRVLAGITLYLRDLKRH
jgi:hypothetical protein